jgi:hypothetical protein
MIYPDQQHCSFVFEVWYHGGSCPHFNTPACSMKNFVSGENKNPVCLSFIMIAERSTSFVSI